MDPNKESYRLIDNALNACFGMSLADLPDTCTVGDQVEALAEQIEEGADDLTLKELAQESAFIIMEEMGLD